MKVLGLHGVYPRSHDAAACLVEDGNIQAFVEEERFTRSKKAFDSLPHNAISFCLESAGIDIDELDAITCGWVGEPLSASHVLPDRYMEQLDNDMSVIQVAHHEAHAASVFYTAPFDEAAVLVIDGQGENESTSIWYGDEQGLTKLTAFDINYSLGYLYGAVSKFCGLGSFGAGKLMGLAPYGKPRYVSELDEIFKSISLPQQLGFDSQDAFFDQFTNGLRARGFTDISFTAEHSPYTYKTRQVPNLGDNQRDLAASVQELLERKVLQLAQIVKDMTGSAYVCLAGGVTMNCVANSAIQDSGIFEDAFMQPGCEDCGVALGSALAYTKQRASLQTVYTGPSYNDEQIGNTLSRLGIRSVKHDNISAVGAELLAQNVLVGWFQGGLEYGPRALGGRSILANPATTTTRDEVNVAKQREPWRPFGPSVLAERADELFENAHESKFMLRSFKVKDSWKGRLAAVVHVDGSTRPQTVQRSDNPPFYDLIQRFERLTGLPAVLNTSFNSYDEPIVATPIDAIRTFFSSSLGALILGSYVIVKQGTPQVS